MTLAEINPALAAALGVAIGVLIMAFIARRRFSAPRVNEELARLKRLQDDWQDRQSRYRLITEMTSDVVFSYDIDGEGGQVSEWQVGSFSGAQPSEPLAWFSEIHPDDLHILAYRVRRLERGHPSFDEFRLLSADGQLRWVRVQSRPELDEAGRLVRVVGAAKEITQDKRWEEALAESEGKLQVMSRTASMGYWEYYPAEDRTLCSPVIWQIWGLRPGSIGPAGKIFLRPIHPEDRERVERAYEKGENRTQIEFRVVRPDGSIRHVHEHFTIDYGTGGKPKRYFGVTQDITARKLTEGALRESEVRYHAIVEDQTELIRRCDRRGVCARLPTAPSPRAWTNRSPKCSARLPRRPWIRPWRKITWRAFRA